jgi:hypothetical protein
MPEARNPTFAELEQNDYERSKLVYIATFAGDRVGPQFHQHEAEVSGRGVSHGDDAQGLLTTSLFPLADFFVAASVRRARRASTGADPHSGHLCGAGCYSHHAPVPYQTGQALRPGSMLLMF